VASVWLSSVVFVFLWLIFCALTSLREGVKLLQRFHIFEVDSKVSDERNIEK
jgi:hypothetical protein